VTFKGKEYMPGLQAHSSTTSGTIIDNHLAHVVLLIDDQPLIAASLRQMLADAADVVVHYCQYPAQALSMAAELKPSVILQDLVMPEISGLDLVRYFRAASSTCDVPIVVLSSRDDPATKAEAFSYGANDYLVKLPDRLEMLARIRYHSRAYQLLLERNQVMRQNHLLLESAGEGIFGLDKYGRITFINPAAAKMLGFAPEELLGRVQHQIIHYANPDGTPSREAQCPISIALEKGVTAHVDNEVFWRRNGMPFPVEYTVTPILIAEAINGCVVTFRDISERRHTEIALREAKEAAEHASYAKSRFLANMSHELRTPLNAIIGYSEMLEEELHENGLGELNSDVQKIRAAGRHLLGLISDILDISKIEAGKMDAYFENGDIAALLQNVINTTQPLLEKKNNTLEIYIEDNIGQIKTDTTKFQQILLNLLSNAAKFCKEGTITLNAVRTNEVEEPWLKITVSDTGIGMTSEQQRKIFQPFTQADISTTREYGGTGLGLAISKKFVQMLGGSLSLSSTFGQGTCFTLILPLDSSHIPTSPLPVAPQEQRGYGNIVVLISADAALTQQIHDYLVNHNYAVAIATTAPEALALTDKLRPDMIILDQCIKDSNPAEILSHLHNSLVFGDIPVLALGLERTALSPRKPLEYLPRPPDDVLLQSALQKYAVNREAPLVMIIDDAYDTRVVTSLLLKRAGWRVFSCENGRVGLAQLRERKPILIVLDLKMPDMDGFEFLTHVRKDETWFHIPVIIFSSIQLSAEEHLRLTGQSAALISKGPPGAYQLLLDKIQEIMRH
jgi:PAS domain S-box-containing protein